MSDYAQNHQGVRGYGVYESGVNDYPNSTGIIASQRTSAPSGASQVMALTAVSGTQDCIALDIALRDETGSPYTQLNPLPVTFAAGEGTAVQNYDTQSINKDASANHDYLVSGGILMMTQVMCAASDKSKFELQYRTSATGSFNTVGVKFVTPTVNNADFEFKSNISVPDGGTVRVIKTNQSSSNELSIYDTILGFII